LAARVVVLLIRFCGQETAFLHDVVWRLRRTSRVLILTFDDRLFFMKWAKVHDKQGA